MFSIAERARTQTTIEEIERREMQLARHRVYRAQKRAAALKEIETHRIPTQMMSITVHEQIIEKNQNVASTDWSPNPLVYSLVPFMEHEGPPPPYLPNQVASSAQQISPITSHSDAHHVIPSQQVDDMLTRTAISQSCATLLSSSSSIEYLCTVAPEPNPEPEPEPKPEPKSETTPEPKKEPKPLAFGIDFILHGQPESPPQSVVAPSTPEIETPRNDDDDDAPILEEIERVDSCKTLDEMPHLTPEVPDTNEKRENFRRARGKKYICDECNCFFTLRYNLQHHIWKYHHPQRHGEAIRTTRKKYKCTTCCKIFNTFGTVLYKENAATQNATTLINFTCMECEKLPDYELIHTCRACDARFARLCDLAAHYKQHTTPGVYTCDHCRKQFKRVYYLVRHKRNCRRRPSAAKKVSKLEKCVDAEHHKPTVISAATAVALIKSEVPMNITSFFSSKPRAKPVKIKREMAPSAKDVDAVHAQAVIRRMLAARR